MINETVNDVLNLSAVIKDAFPNALVRWNYNFDDTYCGWDVCPEPGVMIRVGISHTDGMRINITAYILLAYSEELNVKTLFCGQVPPNRNVTEPDVDFIRQLLKNYHHIG